MSFRRRLTGLVTVAALLVAAPAALALPSTPQSGAWVTNGLVRAIAQAGDTTYLGGEFTYVGPRTGHAIRLAKADASLQTFPEFAGGPVSAIEADGSGGWYVGGSFTHVGGSAHARLVHILPSGSVDPAFNPDPSGTVQDLALSPDGGELYAAGSFASIGGQAQRLIAQLDPASGAASATWNPVLIGGSVNTVEVHPTANFVYIGGQFSMVDGTAANNFAEIFSTGGGSLSTAFPTGADSTVYDVEVEGNFIYVAGSFSSIEGAARNGLAALTFAVPGVSAWDPDLSLTGSVKSARDIDVSGSNTIHVVGRFDKVGADSRNRVAEIDDAASGSDSATTWNPNPTGNLDTFGTSADTLAVDGSTVYVGGNFTSIGGAARNGLAAIDSSGAATSWDANVSDTPRALALDGSNVLVGGDFTSAKGVRRSNLAALDLDGTATAWDPGTDFNKAVWALAVAPSGSPIYVGGSFNAVGGSARANLAAVDAAGAVTSWNPDPSSDVNSLLVSPDGQTVYVGGQFSTIGGQSRDNLAALSAATGTATGWNPAPNSRVDAMVMRPDALHLIVGGDFNNFGPTMRNYLAELDVGSDTPTGWAPEPDGQVACARPVAERDHGVRRR